MPACDQGGLQLAHPFGDLGDVHERRVRRAGDQARPVAHGLAGELERGREIGRAVVDARQEVEVKLDAIHALKVVHARGGRRFTDLHAPARPPP